MLKARYGGVVLKARLPRMLSCAVQLNRKTGAHVCGSTPERVKSIYRAGCVARLHGHAVNTAKRTGRRVQPQLGLLFWYAIISCMGLRLLRALTRSRAARPREP